MTSDDFVAVSRKQNQLHLGFSKDYYRIGRHIDRFGKDVLITDRADWSTERIVLANLNRYAVEQAFRQAKDDEQVAVQPLRHWTDGKIRCHMLTCVRTLLYAADRTSVATRRRENDRLARDGAHARLALVPMPLGQPAADAHAGDSKHGTGEYIGGIRFSGD